ncbi:MAG: DNA alkylation repair protein [Selenomonas ruminantium]|jgi:3-methyladenine DNA glycosylase AlkD|uniref:DNA alkylation repair protein n=1 Tax=Selenomonas ruminantium TaxID=971 RepID=A0A927WHV9_SELRU|nr:DNA alkylation repair protein [Selenomonas ruminantium]MBE6084770.1 DNA alkylation repair protein [Selenomonas ruminantium]
MDIQAELFALQDKKYQAFQSKLMPTVAPEQIIGVRTPALRKLAKEISKGEEAEGFLATLPHTYFEENQLHAFILSGMKDYEACMAQLEKFLPYVDNWATCDQMSPKIFKKHRQELIGRIKTWLTAKETYKVRFAIGMLMEHFLDEDFDLFYLQLAAQVRSEEYYVNMMTAWYFATALVKQYEAALPFIEGQALDVWTHNKAIQKAIESRRITTEQKTYLRTLKISRKVKEI